MWNKLAITLGGPVEVLDEADPFVVLGVLIIVTATLLAFTLVFVLYRKDPEAFDWDNFAPWLADWLTTTDHKKIGTTPIQVSWKAPIFTSLSTISLPSKEPPFI